MTKPQLFLVHFAGGNCYSFQFLRPYLPGFEFIPLELPGRGRRSREKLIKDLDAATQDMYRQIKDQLKSDRFFIYGHSMGALIALQVTHLLERDHRSPIRLIVTGNPGPDVKENKKRHLMDADAFLTELREIGGIPEQVLSDKDTLAFFDPILRADFEIIEKDVMPPFLPVEAPITAIMGDTEEQTEGIGNWRSFTRSGFDSMIWEGNHFFIHDHAARLAAFISGCYESFCKERIITK